MAQNKVSYSPTSATAPNVAMPSSISSSSTYLGIPIAGGRMARSSSHESFATDVSLLSLSSFTSEIPTRIRSAYDKDDEPDSDRCDYGLAKYREDMFEKMLETHALSSLMSRMMNSSKSRSTQLISNRSDRNRSLDTANKTRQASSIQSNGLTQSEEEMLRNCSDAEPRIKGSLYKSFSTSDVLPLSDALLLRAHSSMATADPSFPMSTFGGNDKSSMKTKCHASQSWIPNDYARASQSRRDHLEYLRRVCTSATIDDEWHMLCREDYEGAPGDDHSRGGRTPDTSSPSGTKGWKKEPSTAIAKNRGKQSSTSGDNRRSNSEETVNTETNEMKAIAASRQILTKKINFSKEISSCIRDDLMQKLSKHKFPQQNASVTKHDLEREKGRPLTRLERNFIIFHWLQSLDEGNVAGM